MTWLEFFAEIIDSLAWPGVVLFFLIPLRPYLRTLLLSIKELTLPGGFTTSFDLALSQAERQDQQITEKKEPTLGDKSDTSPKAGPAEVDELAVQFHPTGVVMESWKEVEAAARLLLKTKAKNPDVFLPAHKVFDELSKNDLLTQKDREIIDELRKMRNMVAHTPNVWISPSQAERFKDLAYKLSNRLRIRKNVEHLDASQGRPS